MKSQYIEGGLPKKGELGQFADLRGGGLCKKEGVAFLRGVDTPVHTMIYIVLKIQISIRKLTNKSKVSIIEEKFPLNFFM